MNQQSQAIGHSGPVWPQIELDASAPSPTYQVVEVNFSVTQDGTPFFDQTNKYSHCSPSVVSFLVGNMSGLGATLGPKGQKPKNQQFDLTMVIKVDGKDVANGTWTGMGREGVLTFEKYVLHTWNHMNESSFVANKAHGKI